MNPNEADYYKVSFSFLFFFFVRVHSRFQSQTERLLKKNTSPTWNGWGSRPLGGHRKPTHVATISGHGYSRDWHSESSGIAAPGQILPLQGHFLV